MDKAYWIFSPGVKRPGSETSHLFRNQYWGTECNIYTSPYLFLALYPIKHTDMLFILGTEHILTVFVFKIWLNSFWFYANSMYVHGLADTREGWKEKWSLAGPLRRMWQWRCSLAVYGGECLVFGQGWPFKRGLSGPQSLYETFGKGKNLCPSREFKHDSLFFQPAAPS
jgi:hypothetical protein